MESNELYHFGVGPDDNPPGRGSGRYPKGSGENPYQHEGWSVNRYRELKANGLTDEEISKHFDISEFNLNQYRMLRSDGLKDTEIAGLFGIKTGELRAKNSNAVNQERAATINEIQLLKNTGMSTNAIAKELGMPESTVRSLLTRKEKIKADSPRAYADVLKDELTRKKYLDVGAGTELDMGITRTKLTTALDLLKEEGYEVIKIQEDQPTGKGKTTITCLCPPGTTYRELKTNTIDIKPFNDEYAGPIEIQNPIKYPVSIDSDRVLIRYAEDGGKDKDGVIELRKGVNDISLGDSLYAQVRIAVDDKLYLKGMAMYATEDMPPGKDIIFNTNKTKDVPFEKVLKPLESDPSNPFKANIRKQLEYEDSNGEKKQSPINIINEEGKWGEWSKTIASQMLSKQSLPLIKRQLDLTYKDRKEEFDEIMSLTNPAVKQKLLNSFAEDCDAAAVHLKVNAFPRQAAHVILPVPSMKETEIYAPNYNNGEKVVLIRYPHAGTFEIPMLTVNNKQPEAKKSIGDAIDAVGINPTVAGILSGADFDGDTVQVIPVNDKVKITTSKPFDELKNFDTKVYKLPDSAPEMTEHTKQNQMGRISNLINDMTIQKAPPEEMVRAVKHSMVVIDAKKHHLDYKRSEQENRIDELKEKYQHGGGASTLLSKASAEKRIPEVKKDWRPNPETGELVYKPTGKTYDKWKKNDDGTWRLVKKNVPRETVTTWMADTPDAYTLSTGTPVENAYADYANKCKAMANEARKAAMDTKGMRANPEAKKQYAAEVQHLEAQLIVAKKNAPRERQAIILANEILREKVKANPELKDDKDGYKKAKNQAMNVARNTVGAKKHPVEISEKEWEAIQHGAIAHTTLKEILNNADMDIVRQYATPRNQKELSNSKQALAKSMYDSGFTYGEIAERIGVSTSQVQKIVKGKE